MPESSHYRFKQLDTDAQKSTLKNYADLLIQGFEYTACDEFNLPSSGFEGFAAMLIDVLSHRYTSFGASGTASLISAEIYLKGVINSYIEESIRTGDKVGVMTRLRVESRWNPTLYQFENVYFLDIYTATGYLIGLIIC